MSTSDTGFIYRIAGRFDFPIYQCRQNAVALHRVTSGAPTLVTGPLTDIQKLVPSASYIKAMILRPLPENVAFTHRILGQEMSHLEALRVDTVLDSQDLLDGLQLPVYTLRAALYPALHTLMVRESLVRIEPPLYNQLRLLSFERTTEEPGLIPLAHFLDMLPRCPRLEHIYVGHYIDVRVPAGAPPMPLVQLANLRNLKYFALVDRLSVVSKILSHVVVPKHVDLIIEGLPETQEESAYTAFRKMLPDDKRKLEILRSATRVRVRLGGAHELEECIVTGVVDDAGLDLELVIDEGIPRDDMIVPSMMQALDVFEGSPVQIIELQCDLEGVRPASWVAMFDRFPDVRELEVNVTPAQSGLASLNSLFSALVLSSRARQGPVCPRLQRLTLTADIGDASANLVNMICHCLSGRARYSVPRLHELAFDLDFTWDAAEEARFRQKLVPWVNLVKVPSLGPRA